MSDIKKPTVHMNGTSKSELMEQLAKAGFSLQAALDALAAAAPNGRDYYTQDGGSGNALTDATREHRRRLEDIHGVLVQIQEIHEHVADQGESPARQPNMLHLGILADLLAKGVLSQHALSDGVHSYRAEASSMGFRPGNWPRFQMLIDGDLHEFTPVRQTGDDGRVYHDGEHIEIYVFND